MQPDQNPQFVPPTSPIQTPLNPPNPPIQPENVQQQQTPVAPIQPVSQQPPTETPQLPQQPIFSPDTTQTQTTAYSAAPIQQPQVIQPAAQPAATPTQNQMPIPPAEPTLPAQNQQFTNQTPTPIQQSVDSSQLGYVPPVTPELFSASTPITPDTKKPKGIMSKIKIPLIIIFSLLALSGAGIFAKDTLFTGSKIKNSDLINEKVDGVSYQRPKQWQKVEDVDFEAAFSEDGKKMDDTDQGMGVMSENIGGNYNDLPQKDKEAFETELKKGFTNTEALGKDSGCANKSKPTVNKISHANYPLAYKVEITCDKYAGRNVKGVVKAIIAIKDSNMDIVAVGAVDKTWAKSGDALNSILDNFKHEN